MRRITPLACLLLLIATFAWPPPTHTQLRIKCHSTHARLWRSVHDALPRIWQAHYPIMVQEYDDGPMDAYLIVATGIIPDPDSGWVVCGLYERGAGDAEDTITIRASLNDEDEAEVFAHELGHEIWARVLSTSDKARYRKLWGAQKRSRHMVSEYAAVNVSEGFAEAFAYYVRRPETLRATDGKSFDFLAEIEAHAIK